MAAPDSSGFFSWSRLIRAAGAAWRGIAAAWRDETAFRQECMAALILIPAGLLLGESPAERAMLVGCVLLVLVAELLNTGVEAVVDIASPEFRPLAAKAKNAAAGAVLVAVMNAGAVWGIILWPN